MLSQATAPSTLTSGATASRLACWGGRCRRRPASPPQQNDAAAPKGQKPKAVDLSGDGGVTKLVIKPGKGAKPKKGQKCKIKYEGKLEDGTIFDSNDAFIFILGAGQEVIEGWDVGVARMVVGEKAKLTIKSKYAYGEDGDDEIPPDATLTYEMELLSVA